MGSDREQPSPPPGREPALDAILAALADGPVVIEGEAGIGKTTAWAHTVERAADAGVRVLSTRASAAEARMTFAALAELLDGVDPSLLGALAPVQRIALDRVLLRGDAGPPTDERVASAAFLSLLELLSAQSPVLVAIDDVQWLDSSSKTAVAFAARRLKGPIG
ncbi:MAG: ATP-binding protein, partial [Acidimicrobiales bacterium]|nr:ATP-binding protein [Acidimicrobiales bacterium]